MTEEAAIDAAEMLDWLGHDLVSIDQGSRRVVYVSPSALARLGLERAALVGRVIDDAAAEQLLASQGFNADERRRVIAVIGAPLGATETLEFRSNVGGEAHWRRLRARVVAGRSGPRVDLVGANIDDLVQAREERAAALALQALAEAVHLAPDLKGAAEVAAARVREHLQVERAILLVFDGRTGPLGGVRAVAGPDAPLPAGASRAVVEALLDRFGPVAQLNFETAFGARNPAYTDALGLQVLAYALIGSERERLGLVSVNTTSQRIFAPSEMAFLKGVAERLAGTLAQKVLDDERRHAASEVAEAQRRLSIALDSSGTGVWEFTPATGSIHYDATTERILEVKSGPEAAQIVRERIHPDDVAELARVREAALDPDGTGEYRLEYRYEAPGGLKYIRAAGRCFFDAERRPLRMIGTLQDVTDSRRLEAKLVAAQKLESLGVLAGGIAHDFNNLLVGVLGNAGLAKLELPGASPALEAIDGIETAALRASELTRQLLAYAGKARFVISAIHLDVLVQEMGHLLTAVIGKGVVLRYQFARGLPPVRGDATQIRQVVMNLITNASDAIGERSGIVTVATSLVHADRAYLDETAFDYEIDPGDYVCLQVSDTGVGMSAETKARMFEPFYTTKFTGRGLGLAAVQGILRAHRGALKVYSEPGRGTTIKVLLPIGGLTEGEAKVKPVPGGASSGAVLVVDDEETMRNVTRRLLSMAGFTAVLAADGVEGVEVYRARQKEIDLVILDVTMPRMGGEEAFRQLRLINPDVRVILASGYSEQEATAQFAGKGLAGFIEKPFQAATFLEKVRQALRATDRR